MWLSNRAVTSHGTNNGARISDTKWHPGSGTHKQRRPKELHFPFLIFVRPTCITFAIIFVYSRIIVIKRRRFFVMRMYDKFRFYAAN